MKKLLFILLCITVSLNCTDTVKLPNERILKERLIKEGFESFIQNSLIIKKLADQKKI